jgi:hypothetical protein
VKVYIAKYSSTPFRRYDDTVRVFASKAGMDRWEQELAKAVAAKGAALDDGDHDFNFEEYEVEE